MRACVQGGKRLKQLVNWCGKGFDGLVLFDECHKAKNLVRCPSFPHADGLCCSCVHPPGLGARGMNRVALKRLPCCPCYGLLVDLLRFRTTGQSRPAPASVCWSSSISFLWPGSSTAALQVRTALSEAPLPPCPAHVPAHVPALVSLMSCLSCAWGDGGSKWLGNCAAGAAAFTGFDCSVCCAATLQAPRSPGTSATWSGSGCGAKGTRLSGASASSSTASGAAGWRRWSWLPWT